MPTRKRQILNRTVRSFLKAPHIARLATVGPEGYPHIVPLYFVRDGDDLVFGSDRDERKVRNALANPKGAVVIGGDPATDEAGYMIQGDLSIEDDNGQITMRKLLSRYETKDEADRLAAEWARSDLVIIRLSSRSVIRVW
jgi:nitroimidazol reductase NimA-like FMN-containing flavoprotein (pyridoxamine 5'-phosphate oxidase superfamily)